MLPDAERPFTGARLDRADVERKEPQTVSALLERGQAVFASAEGVLVDGNRLLRAEVPRLDPAEAILLGLEDGTALFAVDLDAQPDGDSAPPGRLLGLREAGSDLPRPEGGLAAYVMALLNWHRHHGFCANCGAQTDVREAGYSRHCPRCGTNHFPRTDPVVIMTVEHDRRLLLGRRAGWPSGRCSVLAGFISPGESAEEAVVREVFEESGIVARDPVYVASQPWPFPSSLMLGFDAVAEGGEPTLGDRELAEVRWVPLDEVREAMAERNPDLQLPPPVSIARFLIDRWVARHDAGAS